jgi:twitching motility protein PilU
MRDCLKCVISQRLVPRKSGGRIPALEFLFKDTVQIEECLLSGDSAALRIAMQQKFSQSSIFEESLLTLVKHNLVAEEVAVQYATNHTIYEQMRLGTYAIPSLETMIGKTPTR